MSRKILTIYKSVTGFTKEYAEMIAQETGSTLMDYKKATAETMSGYDTIIFGGRAYAGKIDGLKHIKELWGQSKASEFIIFSTGATPIEAGDIINEMWSSNLTPAELSEIPHFYMPGGLRYEKMSLPDRVMMKMFSAMVKKKKDKSEYEKLMEDALSGSYDISSKKYIGPLVSYLNEK